MSNGESCGWGGESVPETRSFLLDQEQQLLVRKIVDAVVSVGLWPDYAADKLSGIGYRTSEGWSVYSSYSPWSLALEFSQDGVKIRASELLTETVLRLTWAQIG